MSGSLLPTGFGYQLLIRPGELGLPFNIVFEESGAPICPRPRGSWALEPEVLS